MAVKAGLLNCVPWIEGYVIIIIMVRVSRILADLRSGAQKFYYQEIRGPIGINNAPGDISRISQGP